MVGDRVAAVAADTKDAAEEAARLVDVEYEDLPLVTLDNALADDAPVLHPDIDSYTYLGPKRPGTSHPNIHGYSVVEKSESGASIEEVFARADRVFEHTFVTAHEFQGFRDVAERTAFLVDPDGTVRRAWRYATDEVPDFGELLAAARPS